MPPTWRRARRLLALVVFVTGCGALRPSPHSRALQRVREHEQHCARATMGVNSPYRMPLSPPVMDPEQAAWLDVLPPEARHAARAGGLEPLLVELFRAQTDSVPGQAPPLRIVVLQQELTLRLIALETQVSALGFEATCTRQRVGGLLSALDQREGNRQFQLAAASLIVGAVTGTVAGVWDLRAGGSSNWPAYIGIGGGVATALLGAAALVTPGRWIQLEHRHNLLRPIALGDDPDHLYPSFVFRMLSVQYEGESTTQRALLLDDFRDTFDPLDPQHREASETVLFGDGGMYDRELLERREALLRTLESAVQGVARHLELLNRALVRVLGNNLPVSPSLPVQPPVVGLR